MTPGVAVLPRPEFADLDVSEGGPIAVILQPDVSASGTAVLRVILELALADEPLPDGVYSS